MWSLDDLVTLALAMTALGFMIGMGVGCWVMTLPVPARPPRDPELGELAEDLDWVAAQLRAHDRRAR